MSRLALGARMRAPLLIYVFCAVVYVAILGTRARGPSDNTHFVSLAQSYLHGQLSVLGDRAPGYNDWAEYQGRWYVVFPPFPALVILPAVAIWHDAVWDRLYWALFAGLGPALLYVLLRFLREREGSGRSAGEDMALTALFAFGSAYFFSAVQGTVWFAAHIVACPLLALYVLFSVQARRPFWAGLMLGLAVATRPSTMYLAPIFLIEAMSAARPDGAPVSREIDNIYARTWNFLRGVAWPRALRSCVMFALPFAAVSVIMLLLNYLRFGDPLEVGYKYLRIRWSGRIEKWGLFNYHYFSKNLAVYLAALPWLSGAYPFVRISRHGLALWFTTPNYLWVLWPKRVRVLMVALSLGAVCVAIADLCYQNSGWIQFAYRFSLDYSVALIGLLALGGRRFGPGFYAMLGFACLVNTFGAITFDRAYDFYDHDSSQQVIFQPD
ncbi:MAG TPA: hypothetical protein VFN67_10535 [Polyangiales bacterium]|nr:hypothetical protein [Polyangiales bacterium]